MKIKYASTLLLLIALAGVSCSNNINGQKYPDQINGNASNANIAKPEAARNDKNEAARIVQKSVDYEKFQKYYHADTVPERQPLYILKNDAIAEKLNVTKFEKDVIFGDCEALKNKPFIEFVKLDVSAAAAQATFRYYVEGVEANLDFEKSGDDWKIVKDSLVEKKFTGKPCQ